MSRRGEPVPFAFVAEADRFQSNITPPPPPRTSLPRLLLRGLGSLAVAAGLVGAVALGAPALDPQQRGGIGTLHQEAAPGR